MRDRFMKTIFHFFHTQDDIHNSVIFWVWSIFLFLCGGFFWGMFLNWGNFDFNFQDWFEITGPRLYFLKDSILQGVLPLHMTGTSALILLTDRYLAIPDLLLSPQIFLLRFMNPALFVLVNWLILYSAGFIGLVIFSRKFNLSPFALTIIFLLFNFNGQIEAHLSIGHTTWGGYFLFPWFVLFMLELQENVIHWRWVVKAAGLLFIVFLQGSFHQFVWLLLFLGLLAVVFPKHFGPIILAGVFACLFSAVRIFPATLISGSVNQEFLGGFPGFWELLSGLVEIRDPNVVIPGLVHNIYVWEFDFYIGLLGTIFLAFFGIYQWIKKSVISIRFLIPMAGLLLLSLGETYGFVHVLSLPMFDGERVTTRFLSLPLVFLVLFAGVNFQKWINQKEIRFYQYLLLLLGLGVICSDLWSHFQLWQLSSMVMLFDGLRVFNPATWVQANYVDSLYTGVLRRGAIVTIISVGFAGGIAWFNPVVGFSLPIIQSIFNHLRPHRRQI
jgi:hypothetical protein